MRQFLAPAIVEWVSTHLLPYEAELRMKLAGVCKDAAEIDDVMQEVYCRILKLETVEQIREPREYVLRMARNIVIDQFRHNTVVEIEAVANLEEFNVEDPSPSPERVAAGRAELKWVLGLISNLPDRCQQVFRARRIYGMSQDATARSLGLSENVVEKETMRGMALISESIAKTGMHWGGDAVKSRAGKPTVRKRHV
jgi:RNA polymerase sigma-70 factor (ECF subfamily)